MVELFFNHTFYFIAGHVAMSNLGQRQALDVFTISRHFENKMAAEESPPNVYIESSSCIVQTESASLSYTFQWKIMYMLSEKYFPGLFR